MTAPIFILGCHRSGTSAVAGLLVRACGVSMGELMPATEANPMGYFEALGVVDAHNDLLRQMERDWTCPPATFRPEALDLSLLEEQAAIHEGLPGVWAMKDPRSMFLLPAWSEVGVDTVRLVAVVRPPADTISSIAKRDMIRPDRADAIVDAHISRLAEIAGQVPLPVINFPGDEVGVIAQVRALAASLELPWDQDAAEAFYAEELVHNRAPLRDPSASYELLMERAQLPDRVPEVSLRSLRLSSAPARPLETHLATQHAHQRNQLWEIADFSEFPAAQVVELLRDGARTGRGRRPGVTLQQLVAGDATAAVVALLDGSTSPHGVVAHQLLADQSDETIEHFFRGVYLGTHPLAQLVIDVPDPEGDGLAGAQPPPPARPRPEGVVAIADRCGWDHRTSTRLSPGRTGIVFRKRISTESELVPMVTEILARAHLLRSVDRRLTALDHRLADLETGGSTDAADAAKQPARREKNQRSAAELELEALRNRRAVRLALWISGLLAALLRVLRPWKR